jgi:hypothetical protein
MTAPSPARRFGLLDAMLLVAAIACGVAVNRATWPVFVFLPAPTPFPAGPFPAPRIPNYQLSLHVAGLIQLAMPHLIFLSFAAIGLRLRRPRPSWRRLVHMPAFVVPLVVLLVASVAGAHQFALWHAPWLPRRVWSGSAIFTLTCGSVGFSALASWLTLAIVGCRSERSWIDFFGRAIGIGWLLLLAAELCRELLILG